MFYRIIKRLLSYRESPLMFLTKQIVRIVVCLQLLRPFRVTVFSIVPLSLLPFIKKRRY